MHDSFSVNVKNNHQNETDPHLPKLSWNYSHTDTVGL